MIDSSNSAVQELSNKIKELISDKPTDITIISDVNEVTDDGIYLLTKIKYVTLTYTGNSFNYGKNLVTDGDVIVDWGDGSTSTINNPTSNFSHTYSDGLTEHTIRFKGVITSIGRMAFAECTKITSVIIPSTVTSIGYGAFYGLSNAMNIVLPQSVRTIDDLAFTGRNQDGVMDLFWTKGTEIIEYSNPRYGVGTFRIPKGTTELYRIHKFNTRLIERDE